MEITINYDNLKTLILSDDLDFYENCLMKLSDEEVREFYMHNPDFMKEYNMYEGRLELLRNKMYREILRGIYKK